MRNLPDVSHIGLPKWPAMLVVGKTITPEQARQVIERTDRFFIVGSKYEEQDDALGLCKSLRMPASMHGDGFRHERTWQQFQEECDREAEWSVRWGVLPLEYTLQTMFNPNGLYRCYTHPSGRVGSFFNVGKHPAAETLVNEWAMIGDAFPFLDCRVTFFNGETCEKGISPVFSLRVSEGNVSLCERVTLEDLDHALEEEDCQPPVAPRSWIEAWKRKAEELFPL